MNTELTDQLVAALEKGAGKLREARLPGSRAAELERLAREVLERCVVAVVGRMNAGKSSFINALLGEDVAKVGDTETTATVNYLKYGVPADPTRPVRCYWHGGSYQDVGRDFLDGLQGNDLDTLRRSVGLAHVEYRLLSPYLERVVLVDTPGTGAVVGEHQNRTAEFLHLPRQLRERNNQATQRLGETADAVIYLVGHVPRATDTEILDDFTQAAGGRSAAMNAVGVMAKVDLQPEILADRKKRAAGIAKQLKGQLNTVVPVSAGIQRALAYLCESSGAPLRRLASALRSIPAARLEKLLDSEEFYLDREFPDCPVSTAERQELLGLLGPKAPWGVFTAIARVAAHPGASPEQVERELEDLAGFSQLKEVLKRHFFSRARLLRCFRVVRDALKVLKEVRYKDLPQMRQQDRTEAARRDRFLAFIRRRREDAEVAAELEAFVKLQMDAAQKAERAELTLRELDRELSGFYHLMGEVNADFEALQRLEAASALFRLDECEELRRLFGLYGLPRESRLPGSTASESHIVARQHYWRDIGMKDRHVERRAVAERAELRYGLLLAEKPVG